MSSELPTLGDAEFTGLQRLVFELTGITVAETKRLMLQSRLAPRLRARDCADNVQIADRANRLAGRCPVLETPNGTATGHLLATECCELLRASAACRALGTRDGERSIVKRRVRLTIWRRCDAA
jgi:hypothetical protein